MERLYLSYIFRCLAGLLLFLSLPYAAKACDGSGFIVNNVTNNNDGTFTLDVTIYVAGANHPGGTFGGTNGFYFGTDASGGIVSVTPASLTSLNGTTLPTVITGGQVSWGDPGVGPFFVNVAAGEPTQTFNVQITVVGEPSSWSGGGQEVGNCTPSSNNGAGPEYMGCFPPTIQILPVGPVCAGQPLNLSALTTGGNVNVSWSDGSFGNDIVIFPMSNMTIVATANNGCDPAQASVFIEVLPLPSIEPFPPIVTCAGEPIALNAVTQNTDFIFWSNGNVGNPNIFNAFFDEIITVTASNACGSVDEFIEVTAIQDPIIQVIEGDQTICQGDEILIEVEAEFQTDFIWSNGIMTQTFFVTPDSTQSYTATASNDCATVEETILITVQAPPELASISMDQTICEGDSISLNATAENEDAINWSNGLTGNSITVSPAQNESFTATATSGCGADSASVEIQVNTVPTLMAITPDQTICEGDDVNLTVSVDNQDTFSWSEGSSMNTINVMPDSTESYIATAENECGEVMDTIMVSVLYPPSFTVVDDSEDICEGDSSTITIDPELATTIAWSNGVMDSSITVSPLVDTDYTVTVQNICGQEDATFSVGVTLLPIVDLVDTGMDICEGESTTLSVDVSNEDTFTWSNGLPQNTITVSPTSTTTFTAVASNICGSDQDSVTINVFEVYNTDLSITACPDDTVVYQGTPLLPGEVQSFTLSSLDGCDSVVTVTIVELPSYEEDLELQACTGSSTFYNGTELFPGDMQSFNLGTVAGCDSIINVTVMELQVFATDVMLQACTGTTATYLGDELNPGEQSVYNFIATNGGCDSIVTVTVEELPIFASTQSFQACPGTTVDYNGTALNPGDTTDFVLSAFNGCDSTVTVIIEELPTFQSSLAFTACPGSSITYNGQEVFAGDTQDFTLTAFNGCDSVVTVTVAPLPTFASALELQACPGSSVTYAGQVINTGDTQDITLTAFNGCDSVVTVTVSPLPTFASTLNLEACPGTTVNYNGTALSPGDTTDFTLTAFNGCDSVVTVIVDELPLAFSSLSLSTCPGTTIDYDGTALSPGDVQDFVFTAFNGCDSTVTVSVTALPTFESSLTLSTCPGTTIDYEGTALSPGDTTDFVFSAFNGCDSTVTVVVEALPTAQSSLTLEACANETTTYEGTVLSPGDTTDFVFTAFNGCDSTVTVIVNPLPLFESDLELDACSNETVDYNGTTLNPGDQQSFTLSAFNGCDSTVNVTVIELPVFESDLALQACTGFTVFYNGVELNPGVMQDFTLVAENGCDSVVHITVEEVLVLESDVTLITCPDSSIDYEGTALNAGDVEDFTFISQTGCDSIVTVTVNPYPTYEEDLQLEACTGTTVTYNGTVLSPGDSMDFVLNTINGCDSLIHVNVLELEVFDMDLQLSACPGSTVTYNGVELSPNEQQSFTFTAFNGCDSTVNVSVLELPTFESDLTLDACIGTTITYNGTELAPGDQQSFVLTAANGCDSTVNVTVMGIDIYETDLSLQACTGTTVDYNGTTLAPGDVQTFDFTSQIGCDSFVTVTVEELLHVASSLSIDVCEGSTIDYEGTTLAPGDVQDFVFAAANGCDSTVTVTIVGVENLFTFEERAICQGDSSIIFGDAIYQGGTYAQTFTSAQDCDSTHTITLIVNPLPTLSVDTEMACPDESNGSSTIIPNSGQAPFTYLWENGSTQQSRDDLAAGFYEVNVTDGFGCQQNISFGISEHSIAYSTITEDISCFGDNNGLLQIITAESGLAYSLDGVNFTTSSVFTNLGPANYTLTIEDAFGCQYQEDGLIVEEPEELIVILPEDQVVIEVGDSVLINAQSNGGDDLIYTWDPAAILSCDTCPTPYAQPFLTTFLSVSVQNANNCKADDRMLIIVEKNRDVFIPNIFSPNGDGANDVFFIFAGASAINIQQFQIFNRWGEPVFEIYNTPPNDPTFGWDGRFRGEVMNSAVFTYFAEIEFVDGTVELYKGDVILMR
jgi:gliding motility-associated-like protein